MALNMAVLPQYLRQDDALFSVLNVVSRCSCFKNYEDNDGVHLSVWDFRVINCDEVLWEVEQLLMGQGQNFSSPRTV
jgi:hypothetical protein